MTEAISYVADAENKTTKAEVAKMPAEVDGFFEEMMRSQKEIDRLHKENFARIHRIQAAVER